jgi:hypothetical protein
LSPAPAPDWWCDKMTEATIPTAMMKIITLVILALMRTSACTDEMTIARLHDIVNAKESADIIAELKIYPACEHMHFSQTTTSSAGERKVAAASASEWYVVGNFLVIKATEPGRTNEFLVKSYDQANRLYRGWCFRGDTLMFTQIGIYDAEHGIMTWRSSFLGDNAGFWSLSIQRFVSATRNEWMTNIYKDEELSASQSGSCDYTYPTTP